MIIPRTKTGTEISHLKFKCVRCNSIEIIFRQAGQNYNQYKMSRLCNNCKGRHNWQLTNDTSKKALTDIERLKILLGE